MTREEMDRPDSPIGWPILVGLGAVVLAFMALSLAVTATGTARFAVGMGYDATVGYAVGGIFDVAKDLLPVGLLALSMRRALGVAAILGVAWICLVTFSCLATHATVTTAIASIERTGTWKMEARSNDKAALTAVERQLAALSRPTPPRPSRTVREAFAAERVPANVWQDSQECKAIQDSTYFAKACAQVVQLRRELAAAQDYERLSARATELRKNLAQAPIVATSDPLPAAFSATVGRFLPLGGTEGVALLLTMVVEIISCMGLAGLTKLRGGHSGKPAKGSLTSPSEAVLQGERGSPPAIPRALPEARTPTLPKPSPMPAAPGQGRVRAHATREGSNPPSNILPMRPHPPYADAPNLSPARRQGGSLGELAQPTAHVRKFIEERLRLTKGASVAFKELRAAYESWCAVHGHVLLSMPKLAAELKELGYGKRKSNGLIRYCDLQLAA
jgi:uncharacterized RDD family membrane protein YckC